MPQTQTVPNSDQIDGVRESVSNLDEYIKRVVFWGRILMVTVLALSLVCVLVYNLFAPSEKDVSKEVINTILSALSGADFQAIRDSVENHTEWKN